MEPNTQGTGGLGAYHLSGIVIKRNIKITTKNFFWEVSRFKNTYIYTNITFMFGSWNNNIIFCFVLLFKNVRQYTHTNTPLGKVVKPDQQKNGLIDHN